MPTAASRGPARSTSSTTSSRSSTTGAHGMPVSRLHARAAACHSVTTSRSMVGAVASSACAAASSVRRSRVSTGRVTVLARRPCTQGVTTKPSSGSRRSTSRAPAARRSRTRSAQARKVGVGVRARSGSGTGPRRAVAYASTRITARCSAAGCWRAAAATTACSRGASLRSGAATQPVGMPAMGPGITAPAPATRRHSTVSSSNRPNSGVTGQPASRTAGSASAGSTAIAHRRSNPSGGTQNERNMAVACGPTIVCSAASGSRSAASSTATMKTCSPEMRASSRGRRSASGDGARALSGRARRSRCRARSGKPSAASVELRPSRQERLHQCHGHVRPRWWVAASSRAMLRPRTRSVVSDAPLRSAARTANRRCEADADRGVGRDRARVRRRG